MSPLHIVFQTLLGATATLGFAVWFSVPRETLWRVVLVGVAGFLTRQALLHYQVGAPVASFWAAFVVGLVGLAFARRLRYPRLIFTVTAVIPLIPGIPAYESLVQFSHGDVPGGLANLVKATLVLLGLAGGLTAARVVTFPRREPR